MDFLVKHFGMVVLYAICAVVVLGLVFFTWSEWFVKPYRKYDERMEGNRHIRVYSVCFGKSERVSGSRVFQSGCPYDGTYSISDIITAKGLQWI